jgi:hypothetical protein
MRSLETAEIGDSSRCRQVGELCPTRFARRALAPNRMLIMQRYLRSD